jgi:hypothetical protein
MDALYKKSHWFEGIQDKNHQAAAARDDGAKRAFNAYPLCGKQSFIL